MTPRAYLVASCWSWFVCRARNKAASERSVAIENSAVLFTVLGVSRPKAAHIKWRYEAEYGGLTVQGSFMVPEEGKSSRG